MTLLKFTFLSLLISPVCVFASLVLIQASDGDELSGMPLLSEFISYFVIVYVLIITEIIIINFLFKKASKKIR